MTGSNSPDRPAQRSRADRSEQIDRADEVAATLNRLAAGTFARCDICDEPIDDHMVRAAPETDRCARHRTAPEA